MSDRALKIAVLVCAILFVAGVIGTARCDHPAAAQCGGRGQPPCVATPTPTPIPPGPTPTPTPPGPTPTPGAMTWLSGSVSVQQTHPPRYTWAADGTLLLDGIVVYIPLVQDGVQIGIGTIKRYTAQPQQPAPIQPAKRATRRTA